MLCCLMFPKEGYVGVVKCFPLCEENFDVYGGKFYPREDGKTLARRWIVEPTPSVCGKHHESSSCLNKRLTEEIHCLLRFGAHQLWAILSTLHFRMSGQKRRNTKPRQWVEYLAEQAHIAALIPHELLIYDTSEKVKTKMSFFRAK